MKEYKIFWKIFFSFEITWDHHKGRKVVHWNNIYDFFSFLYFVNTSTYTNLKNVFGWSKLVLLC